MAEIRQHYAMTPHSTPVHTPTTNGIGFLDSLLRNLKQMLEGKVNFIPRVKHGIQLVCEKLASFRPFLQNIIELQNELGELKGYLDPNCQCCVLCTICNQIVFTQKFFYVVWDHMPSKYS